jgi:predicted DNA-binding transcriptional regulator AlpA
MHDLTAASTNAPESTARRLRKDGQPWASSAPKSTAHSLVERDSATYIGMSQAWLRQDRRRKADERRGPSFIKVGRSIRYRLIDLDQWLANHRVGSSRVA